jgi:recombination protein RecA
LAKKTKEEKALKRGEGSDIFQQLADQTNGELLSQMKAAKYFIDTGNLAFNFVSSGKFIHGGLPGGRISEFYGPSSSAKSLWATNLLFGCQKLGGVAVLLDCENASNPEWIKKASHLDIDKVVRYTPKTLEDAFLKMYNIIKVIRSMDSEVPIMIVYDSIAVSPTARELREIDLPESYTEAEFKKIVQRHEQPGERAKVCSGELRKLNGLLEEMDATVLIINQVREKIGVMFGSPEAKGGGGKSLEFYCSQSFRTSAHAKITNPKLGDMVTGINVKIANKKNRFFRPHASAEGIQLLFDRGINPLSGLLDILIQSERIVQTSAGNYMVADDYLPEGKEGYTFKSSKVRQDVPRALVLDCPKIIDAESREEVEEYLAPFADFEKMEADGSLLEVSGSMADLLEE